MSIQLITCGYTNKLCYLYQGNQYGYISLHIETERRINSIVFTVTQSLIDRFRTKPIIVFYMMSLMIMN